MARRTGVRPARDAGDINPTGCIRFMPEDLRKHREERYFQKPTTVGAGGGGPSSAALSSASRQTRPSRPRSSITG
jgi:hypothetical protein